ncbi:MAG TPA: 23S rRNA (adenine(2503)-C(2))-methyltransferase RlmN [Planctomycetota bacterium]|nr:23S rRNA (adenine(2503)-C(2))-methyltransferase RlmN [Planctomycetota bacterium]
MSNAPPESKALSDFDLRGFEAQLSEWKLSPRHAHKLLREYYRNGGRVEFLRLELGRGLEAKFGKELLLRQSSVIARSVSVDGTVKFLLGMHRGGAVEAVLMDAATAGRAAGCVSSQIGCAMGCDFCASTRRGLERNLEAGEIVEQFLELRAEALASKRQLRTLVFMGMGEPLQNLDNVIAAVKRIACEELGELGWRQITISTVGIVPGIERLADEDLNVILALSLHAPDDETRSRIVPLNKRYPVAEIMAAARGFAAKTGRIPNIEYCMLGGVNDSDAQARQLAELMRGFRAHVNLIPYNSIGLSLSGVEYRQPSPERQAKFIAILRDAGVAAHFRKTRGGDVNAACGQLRETAAKS